MSDRRHPRLEPLDTHEVRVVGVLTALWIAALIVLIALREQLPPDQRWWIWTCVAGIAGGLVGIVYLSRRRRGIEKRRERHLHHPHA